MKIITINNLKGGVGKTTVTFNLAYELAKTGKKIICIDLDQQQNLTSFLDPKGKHSSIAIDNLFREPFEFYDMTAELHNMIFSSRFTGIDFIPGTNKPLNTSSDCLLTQALSCIDDCDYVLIDTHPDFGAAARNALVASDLIIAPVLLDGFSRDNMLQFIDNMDYVETYKRPNGGKYIYKMLANKVRNTKAQKAIYVDLVTKHSFPLFDTCITNSACVESALLYRKPVCKHRSKSGVAQDFRDLAEEVRALMEDKNNG